MRATLYLTFYLFQVARARASKSNEKGQKKETKDHQKTIKSSELVYSNSAIPCKSSELLIRFNKLLTKTFFCVSVKFDYTQRAWSSCGRWL